MTIEPRSSAARVPITQPLAPRSNVQYSDQYLAEPMESYYGRSKYNRYAPVLSLLHMIIS
jgi:hypothetical protein